MNQERGNLYTEGSYFHLHLELRRGYARLKWLHRGVKSEETVACADIRAKRETGEQTVVSADEAPSSW